MVRRLVRVFVVVFVFASQSFSFEVGAIVRKIDGDKRVAVVFANGQERTVTIAADAKILDESGKELSGGLAAKEIKEGTTVTVCVRRCLRRPLAHSKPEQS